VNWIVAALAIGSAFDLAQRSRQLGDASQRDRLMVAAGAFAAGLLIAAVSDALLDALDISGPNIEIGAGIVLSVSSLVGLVTWTDTPAQAAGLGGLVPLLFPIVLTPAVGVVVLAVAARNGLLVPGLTLAVVAGLIAWPPFGPIIGRRAVRMLSSTLGVVAGVAMIVDGAFAV
jgi:hypothetical protein